MEARLEMAKVTSKGQVTIPVAIRRLLGVKKGDKILFAENPDGSVTLSNATLRAFDNAKKAFEGAAEEAGLKDEADVVAMINEIRRDRARK